MQKRRKLIPSGRGDPLRSCEEDVITADTPDSPDRPDSLGSPEHERSGPTIDDAVEKAETGSAAEGDHTPSGQEPSGHSRVEKMADVDDLAPDDESES